MYISIIIPVFNSEKILNKLANQISETLKNFKFEVYFINDCSNDNSWKIIEEITNKRKNFLGISFMKNFGQDNAIMAGLNHCKGDIVIIMDDDLQHSPKDIPFLVEKCESGWDVCFADFRSQKKYSLYKKFMSYINSKIGNIVLKKPSNIYLSPFKALHKSVVKSIIQYDGPFPYIDGLILRSTNSITQISAKHFPREIGKSNYNFFKGTSVFLKHLTGFSIIPLRVAILIGVSSAILGFLLGLYYFFSYFLFGSNVEGWTTLIVTQLIIGGVILVSLGMIGEYVGRVYLLLNKSPQFIIKKKTND